MLRKGGDEEDIPTGVIGAIGVIVGLAMRDFLLRCCLLSSLWIGKLQNLNKFKSRNGKQL